MAPDKFIPVLEDSGDIVDVGQWVLGEACRQLAVWQSAGHDLTMSVNVSMRQLDSNGFVDDVRSALRTHGLAPSSLIIEITETVLMKDANATVARLHRLKDLGVLIAIDDFGTGYSSFAYLRQFPVDVLKIDRSFVSEMSGSPDAAALDPHAGGTRPHPRAGDPGRGHRAGRSDRGPAQRALRPWPGLPVLPAGRSGADRGSLLTRIDLGGELAVSGAIPVTGS